MRMRMRCLHARPVPPALLPTLPTDALTLPCPGEITLEEMSDGGKLCLAADAPCTATFHFKWVLPCWMSKTVADLGTVWTWTHQVQLLNLQPIHCIDPLSPAPPTPGRFFERLAALAKASSQIMLQLGEGAPLSVVCQLTGGGFCRYASGAPPLALETCSHVCRAGLPWLPARPN